MGRFTDKPDGYRFVRGQRRYYCKTCGDPTDGVQCRECRHNGDGMAMREWWELHEVNGGKAKRVGTGRSESEWRAFLRLDDAATELYTGEPTWQEVNDERVK